MSQAARIGDWMQTASGLAYWPVDPRAEEVCIQDIAHALAHICRYGGHCLRFYSVAEHSVLVSRLVPLEHALVALMHDAAEAYCVDVPRPLKRSLEGYSAIEEMNWRAICEKFGLAPELPQCVHDADIAMLFAEQKVLMGPSPLGEWGMGLKTPLVADPSEIVCYGPDTARFVFKRRFHELTA